MPECELSSTAVYNPDWLNGSIPVHADARCQRFQYYTNDTTTPLEVDCSSTSFNRSDIVACDRFVFKTDETTIVRDFNITCAQNDWKLTMVGTVNNVGQFVALPIAGYLSDRFGRKWILLVSVAGSAVFGLLRSFAINYEMFIAMEFLDPVIGSTMYTTAFILALELVGPKMRVTGNNIISCAFSFGEALLGLLAMYFRDWRTLLRILYIPGLLVLPLLYTTAESVRWLLSASRSATKSGPSAACHQLFVLLADKHNGLLWLKSQLCIALGEQISKLHSRLPDRTARFLLDATDPGSRRTKENTVHNARFKWLVLHHIRIY